MSAPWYTTWFDSPYYQLLYQQRDEREAMHFIDRLTEYLQAVDNQNFLDLCCGRGRHSKYLHDLGFQVRGVDLSKRNIGYAKREEDEGLSFAVQDMREPLGEDQFDHIVNLFTSFGYFEHEKDHLKSLLNVHRALRKGGTFTLDFMNVEHIDLHLGPVIKEVEGTRFIIQKSIVHGYVIKDIRYAHADEMHHVQEKVRAFKKEELESLLEKAGLRIKAIFGNYDLTPFDRERSDRLIFICTK